MLLDRQAMSAQARRNLQLQLERSMHGKNRSYLTWFYGSFCFFITRHFCELGVNIVAR
jgi:hypothetical protein